ncbi:unnamed protein product [Hymenolepis diminuta]|uniref:Uncharacterized protein n=1 Tax=Hymenolepis diminuta TaxID=6216 RepID=A0A564ZCI1_HYMDI|nr:unnamed protein product [Hymenolepis diminuta]
MNPQRERARIIEFLKRPPIQRLFLTRIGQSGYFKLEILPNPGGYIELNVPESTSTRGSWIVLVGAAHLHLYRPAFRFRVENIIQGFMACMFVVTKRHEMEMPPYVIQFDPRFYLQLPFLMPSTPNFQIPFLSKAIKYVDNIELDFIF